MGITQPILILHNPKSCTDLLNFKHFASSEEASVRNYNHCKDFSSDYTTQNVKYV